MVHSLAVAQSCETVALTSTTPIKGDRAMTYDLKVLFLLSMLAGLSFIASLAIA